MMRVWGRAIKVIWLAGITMMGITIAGSMWHRSSQASEGRTPGPTRLRTGDEIVSVFVGGTFCAGSTMAGLRESVAAVNRELARRARADGKTFGSIGVAMDVNIGDGIRFLDGFGSFDELIVGRQWLNSGVVSYVWRDVPGAPSLPQLLVIERRVEVGKNSVNVGEDRIVARKLGAQEIIDWAKELNPILTRP